MAGVSWKVEGDYFEGCNCDSICPCIFLNDPSEGECNVSIAWHIEEGYYGSTRLDGLNVAGIFHAPGNMVTGPQWQAALYLDERANQEQAEALSKIFSGRAGGFPANLASFIGEVMGVRAAPIQFEVNGKQRHLRISTVLDLAIERITGGDPNREVLVTNPPLYAAAGFDPVVARSTRHTYHDHGLEWDNSGKNAFYSRFAYAA